MHDPQEHISDHGWRYDRTYESYDNRAGHSVKMIYRDKIMGKLHATTTNLRSVSMENTNLITRRLTGQEWNDALVLMKRSDDRTAGCRCQSGDFTPDLYLQYRKRVLLCDGYQRAGARPIKMENF